MIDRDQLNLPRQVYRLRVLGLAWPHLAFHRARISAHPHRLERQHLREGLGLGLSICQTLIEAHGGRINAVPQPTGAIIYFELPI